MATRRGTKEHLSVLVYLGWSRPPGHTDLGEALLQRLARSRHRVAAVLVRPGEKLAADVGRRGWRCIELPPELCRGERGIRRAFGDAGFVRRFERWLRAVEELRADVGLIFYGSWIPPELFRLPRLGFVNFHPAPLPELKGYEPETLAIARDRKLMWGAVHRVNAFYDGGGILEFTRRIRVGRQATPLGLWRRLTMPGIQTLVSVLDRLANGRAAEKHVAAGRASMATRAEAEREAWIDWEHDSVRRIDCRFRAFNTQNIGICLRAMVGKRRCIVDDVEVHRGRFPGRPGQVMGTYAGAGSFAGAPIIRALDGVAVLRLHKGCTGCVKNRCRHPERILPGGSRRRRTKRPVVRKSIVAGPGPVARPRMK